MNELDELLAEFDPPNIKRRKRQRGRGVKRGTLTVTHCAHGHQYTEENTVWKRRGDGRRFRQCRLCNGARQASPEAALKTLTKRRAKLRNRIDQLDKAIETLREQTAPESAKSRKFRIA